MATYTIKVFNKSLATKSYFAFMEAPIVTSNGGATPVYTNAWATFDNVSNGAWDSVIYTDTTYACWSQPAMALAPGVTLDSGGLAPVDTATNDAIAFTNTGATGFTDVTSPGSAQTGSFEIVTAADFTPASGFVFGLARSNGDAIPAPVATFASEPNERYNITPVVKFYVAEGAYTPGEVLDVSKVSKNCAAIDFTGRRQDTAVVIQAPNGQFTVDYD